VNPTPAPIPTEFPAAVLLPPPERAVPLPPSQCIEADRRCVEALSKSHPSLDVRLADVLRFDLPSLSAEKKGALHVVGNLPYNISSPVLFLLADAAAGGYVRSATVLLQREMARRVAPQVASERGMLSACLGIYADVKWHFDVGA